MERGVVIGGLMICGSFLLAALLNRSAMEEVPTAKPPAAVVAPMSSPVADAVSAPKDDCAEAKSPPEASRETEIEQTASDRCKK